jgi:uncharacterized membrane protein YeaQ/YmgE (transglycosylase-associated protein family)
LGFAGGQRAAARDIYHHLPTRGTAITGPSWLAHQFSGSTRGMITSVLVGVAGAFVGYHVAMLSALGGGIVTSVIAAATGAAVVLFGWRMAK